MSGEPGEPSESASESAWEPAWEREMFAFLDDLESQASAAMGVEREVEVADRARAEYAAVTLASRLVASTGSQVCLDVVDVGRLEGRLSRTGAGWVLLDSARQRWLVGTAHVTSVRGASERSVPEVAWSPVQRLGLGSALRRLAEDGEPCVVHVVGGGRHEGTVARVGQDFLELVQHRATVLVATGTVVAVTSAQVASTS